jgi:hypothetical protein
MRTDGDEADSEFLEVWVPGMNVAKVQERTDPEELEGLWNEENFRKGPSCGGAERNTPLLQTVWGKWEKPLYRKIKSTCFCSVTVENSANKSKLGDSEFPTYMIENDFKRKAVSGCSGRKVKPAESQESTSARKPNPKVQTKTKDAR